MQKKNNTEGKPLPKPRRPIFTVQFGAVLIFSALLCSAAGMLLALICGSDVAAVISLLCAAVLCLLPGSLVKLYAVLRRVRDLRAAAILCAAGFVLAMPAVFSYYVSHDYALSVYRYMKKTEADVYYFAGYESYLEDYSGAEDFMRQMKAAPASIVLDGMSDEKLSQLSAEELKTINSESLWDYCGFSDILGSTPQEVEKSMKKAHEMNAYEFTFKYRGLHAKTFGYMLVHPSLMFSDLRGMITEPSGYSVSFATLIFFLISELFCMLTIVLRFDYLHGKGLIYRKKI